MGRSRSAQARSAVKTSADSLRTVRARQQRSLSERLVPAFSDRIAPANSASSSRTGSITTPAEVSNSRTRLASTPVSTNFPITSARFAAPNDAEGSSAATVSAPGSSCRSARMADASRTVTRLLKPLGGARQEVHRRASALRELLMPIRVTRLLRPAAVRARPVDQQVAHATGHRAQVRAPLEFQPG